MILRLRLYRFSLKIATYAISLLAFYFGWMLWAFSCALTHRPVQYSFQGHLNTILFGLFVWAFFASHYKVTSFDELFRERTGAKAASSACGATFFICLAALYFSRNDIFPRGLLVCAVICLMVLTLLLHACFRLVFQRKSYLARPVRLLVIGADKFARNTAARMKRLSFAPFLVAGYVRLPGQEVSAFDAPIYAFEKLSEMTKFPEIDEAVIAIPPTQFSFIPSIVEVLNRLCLPARAVVDLGEGIVVRDNLFQLGKMQMLDLMSTPTESLDYAFLKRGFDICFSAFILILTAPLFAISALLIKLTSPGPVLFVQNRVGLNGKPFNMYKLRTMRLAPPSECDTEWTTCEASRRTAIGTILRRTSLDELPQFWNVLRGDMSVVGPRPERPHFVEKFLNEVDQYNQRHVLRVGITGWAQVNGWRGDTSIEKRIEYDLYYLENWSLAFDLRIILMTIVSGLINKNAY
jgi:Undecaprenyl-phosphate glucose phosphotransferase